MMKLQQAVQYFRRENGFHRLMTLFIDKYQGLGRIGGSVKLNNLSPDEKEALASLMRRDYSKQKSATVAMEAFELALQKTKFAGITLKELLEGFVGHAILTNEDLHNQYQRKKDHFFSELMQNHDNINCHRWLKHVLSKGSGTRGIHRAYDANVPLLYQQLNNVLTAIEQLQVLVTKGYERLPLFAGRITGDPHGFDLNREQGRILIVALQHLRQYDNEDYTSSSSMSAEEKTELLGYYGIVRDDLLNFVTCAGILGLRENKPMATWSSAYREANVLNIPLREIIKIDTFIPAATYQDASKQKVVFMLENSGVFSAVLDHFEGKRLPPLICTHGQLKLANLVLLDKLVQKGITILYAGDFDPEGLQMAQRILKRYGNQAKLWRYTVEDYLNSISEVELDDTRLKKLDTVTTPAFREVKEAMLQQRKAGYQEYLIEKMVSDIDAYKS